MALREGPGRFFWGVGGFGKRKPEGREVDEEKRGLERVGGESVLFLFLFFTFLVLQLLHHRRPVAGAGNLAIAASAAATPVSSAPCTVDG